MSVTLTAANTPARTVDADLLAVPVYADRVLGPGAEAVDRALGGGLTDFMEGAGFEGKPGKALIVPAGEGLRAKAALLVGLGPRANVTLDGIRRAGAALARHAAHATTVATTLADAGAEGTDRAAAAQALGEGVLLGGYRYVEYKSDTKPVALTSVIVLGRVGARVQAALERATAVAAAVAWARDAVNRPPGDLKPIEFAESAQKLLRNKGVRVEVLDVPAMRKEKLGGVLGVGQGSESPPRLVKMTYAPKGARATIALVGKGVCFDSGGLSLKTASGMETMKTDMGGAAATIATMSVLRTLGVKAKVVAYTPMVENMPSGTAIRPGDVLHMHNGKTVEVLNTDAEGRLILGDALALAEEDGADAIIDLATLTGACMVALGEKIAGLMGNSDSWRDQVQAAADRAGEPVWQLPLPDDYRKLLESEVADLKNISGGHYGGALTAGLFLDAFVEDVPWAHLDIAGPARANADDGYAVRGGTGFGVRTLIELVSHFRKPARNSQ